MVDFDLVRVDLLLCKRLLYKSYREGSPEQLAFLRASKLSELGYLSRLVPEETAALVYNEYNKIMKYELIDIAACLGVGLCLSLSLFAFHQAHPSIGLLKLFPFPFGFGAYFACIHVWHTIKEWRRMQPFVKEHRELKIRINKLQNEIKNTY